MRIYAVTDKTQLQTRLVEAPNPAQALRHVTSSQFTVEAAGAQRVAKLMTAGVILETAQTKTEQE